MQAKFVLKDPKAENETLIFMIFYFCKQRLKVSVGEKFKVNPKDWNSNGVKNGVPGANLINQKLNQMASAVLEAYRALEVARKPINKISLRKEFDKIYAPASAQTFMNYFDEYCKSEIARRGFNNAKSLLNVYNNLNDYFRGTRELSWEDLNEKFYKNFNSHLQSCDYSKNYIGRHWAVIKTVLKKAFNEDIIEKDRTYIFKRESEPADAVYLNTTEIAAIFNTEDLPEYLDRVRDLFIIGCCTGLRFGDFSMLKAENFKDDGNKIRIKTSKTGTFVEIPVHDYVKKIREKYQGNLPKVLSNQRMNIYLKDVMQAAGIKARVSRERTVGGKKKVEYFEKWQLITTHTARRSFATNLVKEGVQPAIVMKLTGHSSIGEFNKYIRFNETEAATMLADHDFFKGIKPDLQP